MTAALSSQYAELLGRVELFAGLDRVTLAKLAAHLEPVPVPAGATLFRQGDPPDGLYLVSRGRFAVFATSDTSDEVRLSACGRGEAVGEIALLTGEARTATVRAEEDGEVLRLGQARFMELVRRDPSVALAISGGLIRRLRVADVARLGTTQASSVAMDVHRPAMVQPPTPEVAGAARPIALARWRWRPSRALVGFGVAALCILGGWTIPPPPGLGAVGWHALASLLALVPLLALDALPEGAIALLLAGVWVLGGVVPARVALGGFATGTWILLVSIFAAGAAIASCGLLYRLALWAVAHTRGGFPGQVGALGLAGLILGAAVPAPVGRTSLIAPAIGEMAEALGYGPGSPPAAGLAMATLVGFGLMVAPFLTSSNTTLLAFALLPEASRAGLHWGTWALRAAPLHVTLLVGLLAIIVWRYRPRPSEAADGAPGRALGVLALQQALLGRPSRQEWIAAFVATFLLVGFATQPLHRIDPTWVGVAAFVLLAGTRVLTAESLRAVNWNFVLLFGVLTGIADVFTSTRLDNWLASLVASALSGLVSPPVVLVGALTALCFGLSFVLRWQAAVPLLTVALAPVARGLGIDPWVVAIVALTACSTFFLPYQSTVYLALYTGTGGKLFSHAQARPVAIGYGVLTLLASCASVPVWHVMGLL